VSLTHIDHIKIDVPDLKAGLDAYHRLGFDMHAVGSKAIARNPDDQLVFAANVQVWELRGAIAAGMSVFSYLEKRLSDPAMAKLPPYYDQCELLP